MTTTNTAELLAITYRYRWAVELFFRSEWATETALLTHIDRLHLKAPPPCKQDLSNFRRLLLTQQFPRKVVVFFSTAYNDLPAYAQLGARSYAGGNGS